jgi:hypothetical protein
VEEVDLVVHLEQAEVDHMDLEVEEVATEVLVVAVRELEALVDKMALL